VRRLALAAWLVVALAGLTLGALGSGARSADGGEVLTATSVCDAQELKALQAEDPQIQIEIPPEFNLPWPTREACLSHAAAEDEAAPGPLQPIQFSHKHHSGLFGLDCHYCHTGVDRSPMAGVPSVELCMGCHAQFPPSYDELEGIRTLKQYWERREPIPWVQVYRLPEHVQFRHESHFRAAVACERCHGLVAEMDKLYLTPDTVWWPWLLPSKKLEMGWCVQCHRGAVASQDCYTCHQ
jgi:hypothetical protein